MKNLLKISLVAIILFTSFNALAIENNFLLKLNGKNEKSIELISSEALNLNVSIVTFENELIYKEEIRSLGATKTIYNLKDLPNGIYTLKLETPLKQTIYTIAIEDDVAQLSAPSVKEFFKPVLVKEKEMITLNFKNKVNGIVDIVIFDEYDEEVFSKAYSVANLTLKFDVSKTAAKELVFIVRYEDEEHIERFRLR